MIKTGINEANISVILLNGVLHVAPTKYSSATSASEPTPMLTKKQINPQVIKKSSLRLKHKRYGKD